MSANTPLAAQDNQACLRKLLSKQIVPAGLFLFFAWVILGEISTLDIGAILMEVRGITPPQWGLAILATAVSFWSMGRMELTVHRLLDTGVGEGRAQISGIAAVATAQMAGFGLLTGTLARWRLTPSIGLWKAAQVTGAVSFSFMVALAVLAAIMALIVGPDLPWARSLASLTLLAIALLVAITIWKPLFLLNFRLPPIKAQGHLLALTLLDTLAAGLALYVLFPEGQAPPAMLFYTVFLLSMGVGLLGTTPGGLGPFEMMMLACFAHMPEAPILAAILGYRMIYFALPAVLAAGVLVLSPWLALSPDRQRRALVQSTLSSNRPIARGALAFTAPRAESGLLRQGELDLLVDRSGRAVSMVAPTGQSLIMLADPLGPCQDTHGTLDTLSAAAAQQFLSPCLYKCNARTAVVARQAGWRLLPVAHEAVINPQNFDISARACRQLRRQLRKAKAEGVCVTEAGPCPPLAEMRQIAEAWASQRKRARGFSMGRFDDDYVRAQKVFLARQNGLLIGFVTFHQSWREETLDLMCTLQNAPAGTTHLLIKAAIDVARSEGGTRLSLAAVPELFDRLSLPARLKRGMQVVTGAPGLKRFKSSFAPRWEPLYLAAPHYLGLVAAGLDLADRITRPRKIE